MTKRVLVTGGCGFLGSHVCEHFTRLGWQVRSLDNMTKHELSRTGLATEAAREHNADFLSALGVEQLVADVADYKAVLNASSDVDYIIHTAAQPAMTISWENPRLDFMSNALGTFNVLEAARELGIPVASCASVHVYGNAINAQIKERDDRYYRQPPAIDESERALQGVLTPLHASKGAGDIYTQAYIDTYQLEAASFRLTGIYGTRQFGGEDHGWVANFAIRSVLDWPITIFGTGKQVRDIVYATDVCRAFEAFYETRAAGIYNIGGGEKTLISLLDSIDIISDLRDERPAVKFEEGRHGDLLYFVCDTSLAKQRLGWEPSVTPREGIAQLLDWIESTDGIFGASS